MMLDAQVLGAPLLDHRGLDLDAAGRVTYLLEQRFRYDYDAPVKSLRQRLVVIPPARHASGCTISSAPARSISRKPCRPKSFSPAASGTPWRERSVT